MTNSTLGQKVKQNIIMVADDDLFMREQVKIAFNGLAKIVEAEDGEQVLSLYKQFNPSVLLLDIHMPKKSGKIVLREILDYDEKACVIMLSADSNSKNVQESAMVGAKGFITKPFTKEVLFKYIMPALRFDDSSISDLI